MRIETLASKQRSVEAAAVPALDLAAPTESAALSQASAWLALPVISLVVAASLITWWASGDAAASGLVGFTFLMTLTGGFAAVCLVFVMAGGQWAVPVVRRLMPVSFVPLALGIVLSLPAVLAAGTFHRPEWSWFSTPVQSLRTAVGCAILLGLARLAWRHPTRGIAVLFPAFFILVHTAFSWDFGMTLQAHWHDTILAPLWIVGSALAGLSLLLLLCAFRPSELRFGADDFDRLGCFMLAFCLLHGYFLYAQTLTVWYGNLPSEIGAMRERLTGSFSTIFWIIVAVTVAAPILLLIFRPMRRSPWACTLIAAAVLIGLWLERVWIVLPARFPAH